MTNRYVKIYRNGKEIHHTSVSETASDESIYEYFSGIYKNASIHITRIMKEK